MSTVPDLTTYGTCTLDDDGCSVCGDVAVPVRVLTLLRPGWARCEDRTGQTAEIATAFTPDARPGDVLLITAGVALTLLPRPPSS
ncbi:MAG: HypC/HybG/HupF family hydrogenase formation chaperone [Bacteroidota bacterium]